MVDRWVVVKKVVKSLCLKGVDHFYSLMIEVSFETKKDARGILIAFHVLMLIHPTYIE